jgi:hypothetical protein
MATYVISDDLRVLARGIQRKFTHNFGDLNLDQIVFLKELDSPSKTKVAVTKQIEAATKVIYGQHNYIIIVFQKRWEEQTPAQKNLHLMRQMLKCKWDGDGLRKYDVEDFYELANAFGADWEYNEQVRDPMAPDEAATLVAKPVVAPAEDEEIDEEDIVLDPEQD